MKIEHWEKEALKVLREIMEETGTKQTKGPAEVHKKEFVRRMTEEGFKEKIWKETAPEWEEMKRKGIVGTITHGGRRWVRIGTKAPR